MRVDVKTFPNGRKAGLSPRCYCLASSNLFNPRVGSQGRGTRPQSRHPSPASSPLTEATSNSQMQLQLPIRAASQAHSAYLVSLPGAHWYLPAGPPALGRPLLPWSAGTAWQGAVAPTLAGFLSGCGGAWLQGVRPQPDILLCL